MRSEDIGQDAVGEQEFHLAVLVDCKIYRLTDVREHLEGQYVRDPGNSGVLFVVWEVCELGHSHGRTVRGTRTFDPFQNRDGSIHGRQSRFIGLSFRGRWLGSDHARSVSGRVQALNEAFQRR